MPGEARTALRPSARPRYRYILFRLRRPAQMTRNELIAALRAADAAAGLWLTRFDGRLGVLRCRRGAEKAVLHFIASALPPAGVEIETLLTSGTIAALERRNRDLARGQRGH